MDQHSPPEFNAHHQTSTLNTRCWCYFLIFFATLWCHQRHDPMVLMQILFSAALVSTKIYNYDSFWLLAGTGVEKSWPPAPPQCFIFGHILPTWLCLPQHKQSGIIGTQGGGDRREGLGSLFLTQSVISWRSFHHFSEDIRTQVLTHISLSPPPVHGSLHSTTLQCLSSQGRFTVSWAELFVRNLS